MVISTLKRYIKIYGVLLRFGWIRATVYHVSFLIELLVEFGYQASSLIYIKIIYSNVSEIAGWSYYEMLFLIGLNIVIIELFLGLVHVHNFRELPYKVKTGAVDTTLLKPMNSLFNLSLGEPYVTAVLSTISGFFLMFYSFNQLGYELNFLNLAFSLILIGIGFIIIYSISTIFASLSFVVISGRSLIEISERLITFFADKPHQVFEGFFKITFFLIIPVVFTVSIPAETILRGLNTTHLLLGVLISIIALTISTKSWNTMIKHYTSASS